MNSFLSPVVFQQLDIWSKTLVPEKFDDFIGNNAIRKILKNYSTKKCLPNLLLTGPHGTCKKNFAVLTAKLYLEEDYERACLHIEGAISRGKDIISTQAVKKVEKNTFTGLNVMEFAKIRMTLKNECKRIIIIYNFEDMTVDAQNALRRIMETQAKTTRFILVANQLDSIIEAIQSRCITLQTELLTDSETTLLINKIRERVEIQTPWEPDMYNIISMLSDGDMRKIVNYIQLIAAMNYPTLDCFHKVFNIPPVKLLKNMLENLNHETTQEKNIEHITFLLKQGYNYADILEMLTKIIPRYTGIPLGTRVKYLEILNTYYCSITPHINNIHLYSLFSEFARAAV